MRLGVLGVAFPDHDQVVRIVTRQRVKEDGINDGENRGVGADTEGESEDSDDGEAGVAKQYAECAAKIACTSSSQPMMSTSRVSSLRRVVLPKRFCASWRACPGNIPAARLSAARISRCARSSSSSEILI